MTEQRMTVAEQQPGKPKPWGSIHIAVVRDGVIVDRLYVGACPPFSPEPKRQLCDMKRGDELHVRVGDQDGVQSAWVKVPLLQAMEREQQPDPEREKRIEEWGKGARAVRRAGFYQLTAEEIDEALALMRSAPSAAEDASERDALLAQLDYYKADLDAIRKSVLKFRDINADDEPTAFAVDCLADNAVALREKLAAAEAVIREMSTGESDSRPDAVAMLRRIQDWACSRIVGSDHPYCGRSAPDTDAVWGAVALKAEQLIAEAEGEKP